VDSIAYGIVYSRSFSEVLTLLDTLAKESTIIRSFTESVNIIDRLYGKKNGVNMLWRNKYTEQIGNWVNKYFNI
jgi:hypothetical protein